jgi:hypothetical protein
MPLYRVRKADPAFMKVPRNQLAKVSRLFGDEVPL